MESTEIADGVRDILEFMEISNAPMAKQITILRSAASLLSEIIVSEATAASMIAAFQNIHEKK